MYDYIVVLFRIVDAYVQQIFSENFLVVWPPLATKIKDRCRTARQLYSTKSTTRDPRIVQSFKNKCKIAYFKITVLPVQMARGYFE